MLRIALLAGAILFVLFLARPTIDRFFFAATEPRAVAARGTLSEWEQSNIRLFEEAAPSVLQIASLGGPAGPMFPGGGPGDGPGGAPGGMQSGSGFIWDGAGHVVTNNHVVENARSVRVRFANGDVADADIVGRAPNYDLAVLRLRGVSKLPAPLAVGTSNDLRVGQAAYAIGNPFGLDQSLSVGVISALKRRLPTETGREIGDVIQTDTAINPGNSGGPLLDSAGRLIGVNTAIVSPSGAYAGVGFAVPVDTVNRVVPELIKNRRVPTPGIGILAADERIAAQLGLQGVIVAEVVPGSSAARAGMRGVNEATSTVGDVIVEANGQPVRRLADLTDQLEKIGVGKPVDLTVRRDGRNTSLQMQVMDVGGR